MNKPVALVSVLASITSGCGGPMTDVGGGTTVAGSLRVTEPFRREHRTLSAHLRHVHGMNGQLASQAAAEQAQTMHRIVDFFEQHLAPHAQWEENHLYDSVDERAGGGANRFTASMRHEHRVVERWIGELRTQAQAAQPDVAAFIRRTDHLLGLVTAHFEAEEEVLLPILDRTMTAEEFERELGRHAGGAPH